MTKVVCKTLMCNDGVVGINGYQYLLDDEGYAKRFDSKDSAVKFLLDNGEDIDWIEEWVEFETITEKRKET